MLQIGGIALRHTQTLVILTKKAAQGRLPSHQLRVVSLLGDARMQGFLSAPGPGPQPLLVVELLQLVAEQVVAGVQPVVQVVVDPRDQSSG